MAPPNALAALLLTAMIVTPGRPAAALPQAGAPRGVAQQVMEVAGEVEEVDRTGRTVTIRTGNTVQAPIYAGPAMPIFDQLARGDRVTIRYYDAVIVELTPGARMEPPKDTTSEAQQRWFVPMPRCSSRSAWSSPSTASIRRPAW